MVEKTECIYCHHKISDKNAEIVPDVYDDDAWEELAQEHDPDCEWIKTRAHRVGVS